MRSLNVRALAKVLFGLALATAAAALVGWALDIAELRTAYQTGSSMKVNTAICICLLALAGWFAPGCPEKSWRCRLSFALALSVGMIVLLTTIQNFTSLNFGIDEFFIQDLASRGSQWAPGRPSPVTLLAFGLLAAHLLAIQSRIPFFRRGADALLAIGWIIPFQALLSFFEGVHSSYGLAVYAQMAPHTAACVVFISSGLIFVRPTEGLMTVLKGHTLADRIGRLLLAFSIGLPPTLFLLGAWGERRGYWDSDYGTVLRISLQAALFAWMALKTSQTLRDSELIEANAKQVLTMAVESREEFLAIASHELRTPLTAMKLHTDLMQRQINKGKGHELSHEQMQKLIAQSARSISRMAHLVEDMLDVSRIEQGRLQLRKQESDLGSLVRESVETFAPQFAALGMVVDLDAPAGVILPVDRERLDQVLINLMTNAIRYAPGSRIEIKILSSQRIVRIDFTDHGAGIAPANHTRVFQRFERLVSKNEVSGLGLGLYISERIVAAHGGKMWVENPADSGARFVMEFPRALLAMVPNEVQELG